MRRIYIVRVAGVGDYLTEQVAVDNDPSTVISISSIGSQLDPHDAIATTGGGSITLVRRAYGMTESRQPEIAFGGLFPPYDAPRVASTLTPTDTSLTVVGSMTELTVNTYIHIGVECLRITAVSGQTLTVARGQKYTTATAHYASVELGKLPVISTYPFAWVGRRIFILTVDRMGMVVKEWRQGCLTDSPRLEDDTVVLSWSPLEGLLTNNLAAPTPTQARLSAVHYYNSPVYIPSLFATSSQYLMAGSINTTNYSMTPSTSVDVSQTGIQYQTAAWSIPSDSCMRYDIGAYECRAGVCSALWQVTPSNPPSSWAQSTANFQMYGMTRGAFVTVYGGYYGTGTTPALDGMLAYCSTALSGRPSPPTSPYNVDPLCCMLPSTTANNTPIHIGSMFFSYIPWMYGYLWTETYDPGDGSTAPDGEYSQDVWRKMLQGELFSGNVINPEAKSRLVHPMTWVPAARSGNWDRIVRYPIRPPRADNSDHRFVAYAGSPVIEHVTWRFATADYPMTASRWWELGEEYIMLEQSLGTGTFHAQGTWYEPQSADPYTCLLKLSYVSQYSSSAWLYHVDYVTQGCAGVGDWGLDRAVFNRCNKTTGRPWESLVNILESNGGSGGTYGDMAYGLAIPESSIDLDTFSAWDQTLIGVDYWVLDLTDQSPADAMRPILLLSGTAIAGHCLETGGYHLRRVNTGACLAAEVTAAFSDDDFIGLPSSSLESGIVTAYEITYKEDSYLASDIDACQIYGQGSTLSIDLSGAWYEDGVNVMDLLQSALQRCADIHGRPRRKWSFKLPFPKGEYLSIGDVISVTSKYLYGYGLGRGVTEAWARIVELDFDLMQDTVSVVALADWSSVHPAGYHPWALITSTSSQTTFTLPTHSCTSPYSTLRDIDYFRAGATVRITLPDGSTASRTISSKSGTAITLSSGINTYGQPYLLEQTTTYSSAPITTRLFNLTINRPC